MLINNAGIAIEKLAVDQTESDWDSVINANLKGAYFAATEMARRMIARKQEGNIVNIASVLGFGVMKFLSPYTISKAGIIQATKVMALELASTRVTVNAVCPGFTDTDLVAGSIDNIMKKTGRSREQAIAELAKHNPQGRLVTPVEVADTVLWLCGEGAGAITGQAIAVAGGEI